MIECVNWSMHEYVIQSVKWLNASNGSCMDMFLNMKSECVKWFMYGSVIECVKQFMHGHVIECAKWFRD